MGEITGHTRREETTPKEERGRSKYNEYNEQYHKSVHTVLAFFLYVSLSVGFMNKGGHGRVERKAV